MRIMKIQLVRGFFCANGGAHEKVGGVYVMVSWGFHCMGLPGLGPLWDGDCFK